jgi:hypothetical protein
VRRVLITGMSGTGKSSLIAELAALGYNRPAGGSHATAGDQDEQPVREISRRVPPVPSRLSRSRTAAASGRRLRDRHHDAAQRCSAGDSESRRCQAARLTRHADRLHGHNQALPKYFICRGSAQMRIRRSAWSVSSAETSLGKLARSRHGVVKPPGNFICPDRAWLMRCRTSPSASGSAATRSARATPRRLRQR